MLGIPAEVMCHKLHVNPSFKPVKQKPRRLAPTRPRQWKKRFKIALGKDNS